MAGTYLELPLGRSLYWDDVVADVASLPTTSRVGEAVLVIADGAIRYWDGAAWQITSSTIVALTANRAVVTDAAGELVAATTTAAEIGYVNGVTSAIQTQLNGKQATGNYITALTSDVSASGPGSVAATVNSVGGQTAANVAAGSVLANAATSANTANAIVRRGAAGEFSAGAISPASVAATGAVSGNTVSATTTVSGADVSATSSVTGATVVGSTSGKFGAAGAVTTSATLEVAGTSGAFLLPRLTTAQRDLLTATAGMMIYNTTTAKVQVREGTSWLDITGWGS